MPEHEDLHQRMGEGHDKGGPDAVEEQVQDIDPRRLDEGPHQHGEGEVVEGGADIHPTFQPVGEGER